MRRRLFLLGLASLAAALRSLPSRAADVAAFTALLDQLREDPQIVEDAWLFQDLSAARGVGQGRRSSRNISQRALDMITTLEVSGRSRYEQKYTRPIWPKGESGVTIGIGYDLRFANGDVLKRDWGMLLQTADIDTLSTVLGLGGTAARDKLAAVQQVVIPRDPAYAQYVDFIHYPTAQTEDIFPNSDKLTDDSFGALVSLVYNRGPAIPKNSPSRKEMYEIHLLMQTGTADGFRQIPDQIRAMKRLWTTPDSRGLVIRRELEAQLFELGLA